MWQLEKAMAPSAPHGDFFQAEASRVYDIIHRRQKHSEQRWNTEKRFCCSDKNPMWTRALTCLCHNGFINTCKGSKCVNQQICFYSLMSVSNLKNKHRSPITLTVTCYFMSLHPYLKWNREKQNILEQQKLSHSEYKWRKLLRETC